MSRAAALRALEAFRAEASAKVARIDRARALVNDRRWANDRVGFAVERLGWQPDAKQAEVLSSEERRLLLNCCRQWGKSTTTSVIALHTSLYEPGALTLLISPTQRQSAELFRK